MPEGYKGYTGYRGLARRKSKYKEPGIDLSPYLPGPQEVQDEVTKQKEEETGGWFYDVLSFSEKIFGGQAIKGLVRGAAERGWEGAGEGFLKGLGTITDALGVTEGAGRITTFGDIRKSFGDTSDQTGAANFALNLLGEIVLSPIELIANPLGVTGKLGLKGVEASASFAKAFQTGQRALMTFRLPIGDIYLGSIGKVNQATSLGLKSVYTNLGRSIDVFQGAMRTVPGASTLTRIFMGSPAIKDPEIAASVRKAGDKYLETKNEIESVFWKIYNTKVGPQARKWYEKNPQYHSVLLTLQELGFDKFDDIGAITTQIKEADHYVRLHTKSRLLATNPHFKELYGQAEQGSLQALNTIYENYKNIPLPKDWLERANLPVRPGVDVSGFERSVTDQLRDIHPDLSPLEEARGGSNARGVGEARRLELAGETVPPRRSDLGTEVTRTDAVAFQARKRLADQAKSLYGEIEKGTLKREYVDGFLSAHKTAMEEIAKREVASGILNSSFEQFLGPYAHRVMTPEVKKMIDDHFFSAVKGKFGDAGLNLTRSFMQERKISDMLTVEANAVFNELGTAFTGHIPLRDLKKHGAAEAASGLIFGNDFWRKLQKLGPEGKQVAEFFRINPLLNDYTRYVRSSEVIGDRNFWDTAFKGPIVRESFDIADQVKLDHWATDPDVQLVFRMEDGRVRIPTRDEVLKDTVGSELRTRYEIHKERIKEDLLRRVGNVNVDFRREYADLTDMLSLKTDAKREVLAAVEQQGTAGWQMSRALRGVNHIDEEIAGMRSMDHLYSLRYDPKHAPHTGHLVFSDNINDVAHNPALNARLDAMRDDIAGSLPAAQAAQIKRNQLRDRLMKLEQEEQGYLATKAGTKPGRFGGTTKDFDELSVGTEKLAPGQFTRAGRVDREIEYVKEQIDQLGWADDYGVIRVGKDEEAINKALRVRIRRGIGNLNADRPRAMGELKSVQEAIKDQLYDIGVQFDDAINVLKTQRGELRQGRKVRLKGIKEEYRGKLGEVQKLIEEGVSPEIFNEEMRRMFKYRKDGFLAVDEAKNTMVRRFSKDPASGRVVEVHEPLFDRIARNNPEMKVHVVDREDLRSLVDFRNELLKPDPLKNSPWVKKLDWMRQVWSAHVTINPLLLGVRARDWLQSMQSLSFGGSKTPFNGSWTAGKLVGALGDSIKHGGTIEERLAGQAVELGVKGAKRMVPLQELFDASQSHGVAGSAMYASEVLDAISEGATIKGGAGVLDYVKDAPTLFLPIKKAENSAWLRAGYRTANKIDDHARLTGFIDAVDRGMSYSDAAAHVKKWLYDSGKNLSYTERTYLRRFIPFYSFTKYALGQNLDVMMTRPGLSSAFDKVRTSAYSSPPLGGEPIDEQEAATILPRFLSEGLGIPFKNTEKGPSFSMFGSYYSLGEVSKLVGAIEGTIKGTVPDAAMRYLGNQIHPVIKEAIEQTRNRDFFTNTEISQIPGDRVQFLGFDIPTRLKHAFRSFRIANDLDRLGIFTKAEADSVLRASAKPNSPTDHALTAWEAALSSSFSPIPFPRGYAIDALEAYRREQNADSIELQKITSKLKRRIEDGLAPDDTAAKALRELIAEKVAEIQRREALRTSYTIDTAMAKKIRLGKQLREKAGLQK